MALDIYRYEVSFKLPDTASSRDEEAVYKEIEKFEKELNRKLRQRRKKEKQG